MGRIFQKPTKPREEVIETKTNCTHCNKSIKAGSKAIICRTSKGKIRARFCCWQHQMEKEESEIEDRDL